MSSWIIYVAIATIIITAGLTWVLWRINAPQGGREAVQKRDSGGDSGPIYVDGGSGGGKAGKAQADSDGGSDSGSDGGGGDGGGGGGK